MYTQREYDMMELPTFEQDDDAMKTAYSLSVADIMGEDHSVWLSKNKKFGFDIEIENEDGELVVKESGIHPYAVESFFLFCKRFIAVFESQCEEAQDA